MKTPALEKQELKRRAWTTFPSSAGKESGADVLRSTTTALLPKVNPGGSSPYSSYHGISPGIASEAEDGPQSATDHGTSKRSGKEELGQIEAAKKLPCRTV